MIKNLSVSVRLVLTQLLVTALISSIQSAPVAPTITTVQQPDGSKLQLRAYGDEWDNGYETLDGYTVAYDKAAGTWQYAVPSQEKTQAGGVAVLSGVAPVPKHLRASAVKAPTFGQRSARVHTGSLATVFILVEFSDRAPVGSTVADWASLGFNTTSSVSEYYKEVSYNNLSMVPVTENHGTVNDGVIGWLNLGTPHPNTGGHIGNANLTLTRNALVAADPYINYASYDYDGNGYVSLEELQIVIVAAGYDTAYGGELSTPTPNLWGHSWFLGTEGGVAVTADGVTLADQAGNGGYVQVGEWHNARGEGVGHLATLGIICHELGHGLNWPDLYDADGGSEGVGDWSLMGTGAWLGPSYAAGSLPCHPDAFCKIYQGWLTPSVQSSPSSAVWLPEVETNASAIQLLDNPGGVDWVMQSTAGTGEYFLVENRQLVGYDAGLPGSGLLVWHIDETRQPTSTVNSDKSRKLVDLEEADGYAQLDSAANRGDGGDPFPGTSGNREFLEDSNPNSLLYGGRRSNVGISQVSDSSAIMTFAYGLIVSHDGPDLSGNGGVSPVCRVTKGVTSCRLKGSINVTNVGNQASGKSALDLRLSDDAVLDGSDIPLSSVRVPVLKPGKTVARKVKLALSKGMTSTGKYLIAVLDPASAVQETNEGNNAIVIGPLP